MTFDASLTTSWVFVRACEGRGTRRRGWNLIFSAHRLGWDECSKASVRYSGRAASQVIKYDTRLRRLHSVFQVKLERKQHPVSVFQCGNNWQLSFSILLFSYILVHKRMNIQWKVLQTHTDANINAHVRSVSLFQKWNYSIPPGSC